MKVGAVDGRHQLERLLKVSALRGQERVWEALGDYEASPNLVNLCLFTLWWG